jgi:6-phosphogluconolactonase (cycloisomerase 2 family)
MSQAQLTEQHSEYWVYIGTATYTAGPNDNLYTCRFDPKTGRLILQGIATKTINPGFVAVHPVSRIFIR